MAWKNLNFSQGIVSVLVRGLSGAKGARTLSSRHLKKMQSTLQSKLGNPNPKGSCSAFLELKQNLCSKCVYRLEAAQAQAEEEEEEEAGGRKEDLRCRGALPLDSSRGLHLNTQGKIVTLWTGGTVGL
jgi:hypothetical protein